ncbi:hypothetical protein DUI87_18110 [Hirundo rustica rustica]|uniref:SIA8F sialyltransferase n=1 Tax=Hirundo rustica rustica TaxID=333673 RepID=A0A3M0K0T7_HIRRU|nr:hypothetical protein DUI87_18110 [Hirundo rustica rustica]
MRAVIALAAALGSLLLGGCLLRLGGQQPLRARGWEEEAGVAAVTPKVVRALRSPLTPLPHTENRTTLNKNGIYQFEQASKCKAIQDNILSSSIKKKRYSEDYYLHIVKKLQNCTWVRKPEESTKFRPMGVKHPKHHIRLDFRYRMLTVPHAVFGFQQRVWAGNKICKDIVCVSIAGVNNAQVLYNKTDMILVLQTNIHFIDVCKWSELASCCDAVHNFIASQNNSPLGSNMSYEVDSRKTILITEDIFKMLPVSKPPLVQLGTILMCPVTRYNGEEISTFLSPSLPQRPMRSSPLSVYPFKNCAVVGNGGILKNSSCGAEIDSSDFVFRCNLPPTTGNISKDVGNKTNLVTVNPSIIAQKYNKLNEKKTEFLENIAVYGDAFLLLPAFSFRSNTATSFKVYHTLKEFKATQRAIFFHPTYLKSLAQFWRTKGVKAYRLSSGFMITSAALELCENVKLYGFWPFSKSTEKMPISHHYYDNQLPKPGFHAMPKEYYQILQLHGKGILKLQFGKCESD